MQAPLNVQRTEPTGHDQYLALNREPAPHKSPVVSPLAILGADFLNQQQKQPDAQFVDYVHGQGFAVSDKDKAGLDKGLPPMPQTMRQEDLEAVRERSRNGGDAALGSGDLALLIGDVEREVQREILMHESRADSLRGAQLLQTGGERGGARGIGSSGFELVRNGNWDAALNIGADPFGVLPDLAGLQQDISKMSRLRAEDDLNAMRQRMTDAGMKNVPKEYSLDMLGNGTTVRNYGATADDLQTKYEGFVRDNRLKATWGDDYQKLRLGKSKMTVQEFEKRVLDIQQQAVDKYYKKGLEAMAKGELPYKEGERMRVLGAFMDDGVRGQLRGFAAAEGINDSMASNLWGVNRNIRSDLVKGVGIPDNRLGSNLFADTTLARKSPFTEQIMKWNALRPNANYLMIRPTNMGGSYVIPSHTIQPYSPPRPVGRSL